MAMKWLFLWVASPGRIPQSAIALDCRCSTPVGTKLIFLTRNQPCHVTAVATGSNGGEPGEINLAQQRNGL